MTNERFFKPLMNITKGNYYYSPEEVKENNLSPACRSRTKLIPRHTRAKNIAGKWMYLLEHSAGPVQNVEVGLLALINCIINQTNVHFTTCYYNIP